MKIQIAVIGMVYRLENERNRLRDQLAARPEVGDITVHIYRNNLVVFTTIPSTIRLEVNGTLYDTSRQPMSGLDVTLPAPLTPETKTP